MANIRIKDLPADSAPKADDKVPIDLGTTRNTTVEEFVFAGRPTATKTEAEAGTDNKKAMTPLAVKQAIDAQTGMRYVPVTRRVDSGTGLSGGQELTGDVTLSLNSASIASLAKADSAVQSVNGKSGSSVTLVKADVGLGNVDNTSDLNKPISTATQTALNEKANSSVTVSAGAGLTGGGNLTANRSIALNAASISSLGKADTALQAPGGTTGQILAKSSNTTNDVGWVSSEAATAVSYGPQTLTDPQKTQARTNIASVGYESQTLTEPQKAQARANIGAVIASEVTKADVGLGNVDNTSDANKPVSTAQQTALDVKASYNWIINGDFTINQRGGVKKPANGVYGFDRWKGHANGIEQIIEALPAGEYTLTWSGGGSGTFGGQTKASPIKAIVAGGNTSIVVPESANKVSVVIGDTTVGNPWVYGARSIALEQKLCERYFQKIDFRTWSIASTANQLFGQAQSFGVMRAQPTHAITFNEYSNTKDHRLELLEGDTYIGVLFNSINIGGVFPIIRFQLDAEL